MQSATARADRIGARVTHKVYQALRHAAELTGATINQFLVQAALEKAEAVIEREQALHLSRRDTLRLLSLLEKPPRVNGRLKAAQARYRKARSSHADSSFDWSP